MTKQLTLKHLVHRLDALLNAGQMCANCCYNIAHKEIILDIKSEALIESYKAWDAASLAVIKLRSKTHIRHTNSESKEKL